MSRPSSSPDASATGPLLRAVARDMERLVAEPLAAGLYLVATPIGNLGDVTLRALSVLARADIVYCEDTRHSARLFSHFSLSPVTRPLHDHNEEVAFPHILKALADGQRVAVISDAGTPLISDPGFRLVRAAAEAGVDVVAIPGASSVVAALVVSGQPTDAFLFAGFLPPKMAARRTRLAALKSTPATLIFFESPQRVAATLSDMADVLGERPAVMARELTKLHEELARGPLSELAAAVMGRDIKGEIVLVVGPGAVEEADDEAIQLALTDALKTMSLKDASKAVAADLGVAKGRVYALGLSLKDNAR